MKVVLDTNVLLAAFAARGLCESVYQVCLEQHQIIISRHILDELKKHLTGKLKIPARQAAEIITFLKDHAQVIKPDKVEIKDFPDKDDLPVLGTASAARADVLVTGDKQILRLKRFDKSLILTPRQFYDKLI